MSCPFCGNEYVEKQTEMDLLRLGGPTTMCRCPNCTAVWYDDTDGGLEGVD